MFDRIRLFPALALAAALLGGVKVMGVWQGMYALVPPVHAADAVKPEAAAHDEQPADAAKHEGDTAAASGEEATHSADKTAEVSPPTLQPDADGTYSPAELQLLQSLSARRAELDKREKDLDMREQVLKVTEKRLEEKMAEIKKVQQNVDAALKTYDHKEDAQMKSLVKVYETMKPADAARIMNTLDMKVLIEVTQRMSERKIAPIMAAMDPSTAKKLTMELATRKPLLADNEAGTATQ
jgi:flagellar motility protein MotE (MotC chaperone)